MPRGGGLGLTKAGPTSLTIKGAAAWDTIGACLATLCAGLDGGLAAALPRVRIGLGLAGANSATLRQGFLAAAPAVAAVRLATDSYIAALGAHGGAPGAIVIVGTGSAGYRIFADGTTRLVGGWGFPVDDAGSGAWLGRRAIGEVLHVVDGRWTGAPGEAPVHRAVLDHCGRTRAAVLDWLHQAPSTRYAELAPIVLRHADAGDPAARRLAGAAGAAVERIARAPRCGRRGAAGPRRRPRHAPGALPAGGAGGLGAPAAGRTGGRRAHAGAG